jgi:hypothetical protein
MARPRLQWINPHQELRRFGVPGGTNPAHSGSSAEAGLIAPARRST